MSFAIGLVDSNFTIIAADTRGTKIVDCGTVKAGTHTDDRRKVFPAQFGWAAAHGGVVLGGWYFEENLKLSGAKSINEIYLNWLYSHKRVEQFIDKHINAADQKKVRIELPSSAAIISTNNFIDGEYRLSLHAFDYAFDIREFTKPGTLLVSNPLRTRKSIRIANRYGKLVKPYKFKGKHVDSIHFYEDADNLHKSIYTIACLMSDASKAMKSVSNTLDAGITLKLSPDEILLLSIHGSAEELKKVYGERHDFSEQIIVCGTLTGKPERMVEHG